MIIPALLGSLREIESRIASIYGATHYMQLDVCDGVFVTSHTWPYRGSIKDLNDIPLYLKDPRLTFEIDAMIENPDELIHAWKDYINVARWIIHSDSPEQFLERLTHTNVSCGLALKPSYALSYIETCLRKAKEQGIEIEKYLTHIQIMGSDTIGASGVALDHRVYQIVRDIKHLLPYVCISVDIGVNKDTLLQLKDAGVDNFVVGSGIFGSNDPVEEFKNLQKKSSSTI